MGDMRALTCDWTESEPRFTDSGEMILKETGVRCPIEPAVSYVARAAGDRLRYRCAWHEGALIRSGYLAIALLISVDDAYELAVIEDDERSEWKINPR